MKPFTKFVGLVLMLVVLMTIPAQAAGYLDTRSSSFFMRSSVYLHETSSRTFQAWFDVTAVRTMDKVGAKEIKIQRSSDDENWTTVATYSMNNNPNLICENTVAHSACVTYTGSRGYYYRAYIKLYAKDSTGSGTWPCYTSSIYLD